MLEQTPCHRLGISARKHRHHAHALARRAVIHAWHTFLVAFFSFAPKCSQILEGFRDELNKILLVSPLINLSANN